MSKKFIIFIAIPGLLLIAFMLFIINSELIIVRQGVLSRVTNCMIPEGCGTEYKVDGADVVGILREKDVGKIVEVIGIKISLPSTLGGTYKGIIVIYYRPILRGAK